jgi:hypothetical protein
LQIKADLLKITEEEKVVEVDVVVDVDTNVTENKDNNSNIQNDNSDDNKYKKNPSKFMQNYINYTTKTPQNLCKIT